MKPYSEDLRKAAVRAYFDGQGSYAKVAKIFNVHPKTLQGWVKMERNGEAQRPRGKGHPPRILSQAHLDRIAEVINEKSSITLEGLRKIIGINAHLSVYSRAVHELGFTYKKKKLLPKNANVQTFSKRGSNGRNGKKHVIADE